MEATYEEIQDQLRTKLEQNCTMLLCLITTHQVDRSHVKSKILTFLTRWAMLFREDYF